MNDLKEFLERKIESALNKILSFDFDIDIDEDANIDDDIMKINNISNSIKEKKVS